MVHLHVVDRQILHVQTLRLTVRLQVVQKHQEELASSLGPSALISSSLHQASLRVTTNAAVVSAERDRVLVGDNVMQILLSLDQRHSLDRSTHSMGVLEVHRQVRTAGVAACSDYTNQTQLLLAGFTGAILQRVVNNPSFQSHTNNPSDPNTQHSLQTQTQRQKEPYLYFTICL